MAAYYGVIHKEQYSDFGLSFPDLPGCITAGSTLEELNAMAAEVLKLHLDGMVADGDPIPEPSGYNEVVAGVLEDPGFHGVTLVSIHEKAKKVRVNISVSEADLELIDAAASREGVDRSGFLVRAAKKVALGENPF